MNILFLTGLFPLNYEHEIIRNSLSGVQNAANKLQWAIVDGLNDQPDVNLTIVNSVFIGSYPLRYKKLVIPSFAFNIGDKGQGINVGFFNIPVLKYFSKYFGLKRKVDGWIASRKDSEMVIIAYAMTSPIVELLNYVKKRYPQIKCILIVPDLPEFMDVTNKSLLYSLVKRMHVQHLKKKVGLVNGFVLLTDHMKEWFADEVAYTVVEGVCSCGNISPCKRSNKEKVILYSGGLCEEYGVLDLVNAFLSIGNEDWGIEIIGDGPLLDSLKQVSIENNQIVIRGPLPNVEVVKRQKEVSILINPRKPHQEFTKYSFPSKTIEYMASGTPMIGYRLPGIPDEYFNYMFEVPSKDDGLKTCLNQVMMLSELERIQKGMEAKKFVLNEKNPQRQCEKIIHLINNVC